MPNHKGKTVSSTLGWQSDDGKVKRFDVVLDIGGKQFKAQTYSGKIAQVGWEGDIETYEKNNYTYVRQPQKEGASYGGGSGGGNRAPDNPHTMYVSYAKDIAIALIETSGFTPAKFSAAVDAVIAQGRKLYDARPNGETAATSTDAVSEVFGDDTVIEDIGDEPLSLDDLPNL